MRCAGTVIVVESPGGEVEWCDQDKKSDTVPVGA